MSVRRLVERYGADPAAPCALDTTTIDRRLALFPLAPFEGSRDGVVRRK